MKDYILKALSEKVNNILYREYLPVYPQIKQALPFSEPDLNDVVAIEKILELNIGEELSVVLSDLDIVLNGMPLDMLESEIGIHQNLHYRKAFNDIEASVAGLLSKCELRFLAEVIFLLSSHCKESYLVGGCIRDIAINKKPKDWDFVTSESLEFVDEVLSRNGYSTKKTGNNFRVLNIEKDGERYEIAEFRGEEKTLKSDAAKRDFTINALYFDLKTSELHDPNSAGVDDVNSSCIKFIGNPTDRLKEDPVRAWRFFRFIRKGFTPDKRSLKFIRANWDDIYKTSNPARVISEINR